jgi:hypothetical protein
VNSRLLTYNFTSSQDVRKLGHTWLTSRLLFGNRRRPQREERVRVKYWCIKKRSRSPALQLLQLLHSAALQCARRLRRCAGMQHAVCSHKRPRWSQPSRRDMSPSMIDTSEAHSALRPYGYSYHMSSLASMPQCLTLLASRRPSPSSLAQHEATQQRTLAIINA